MKVLGRNGLGCFELLQGQIASPETFYQQLL
jgi:hypothetical protein